MKLEYNNIKIKHLLDEDVKIPEFQRGVVWKENQKKFLIETILLGFTIPPLVFRIDSNDSSKETWSLIDGQQRYNSIKTFIEDSYEMSWSKSTIDKFEPLEQFREIIKKTNNKKFSDFDTKEKNIFKNFNILYISFVDYGKLNEDLSREIFSRINTVSKVLNRQELRKSKYYSENMLLLYNAANSLSKEFIKYKVLSKTQIERSIDVELLLTLLILDSYNEIIDIKPSLLDNKAKEIINDDNLKNNIKKIEDNIKKTFTIFDDKIKNSKIFGKYYFEVFYHLIITKKEHTLTVIDFLEWINKEENEGKRMDFQPIHTKTSSSKNNSIGMYYDWISKK